MSCIINAKGRKSEISKQLTEAVSNDAIREAMQQEVAQYMTRPDVSKITNKAIASDETKLAIEYVFEIGDTTNGAIYFHSGRSRWHERATKIERTVTDQWHKFYKLR